MKNQLTILLIISLQFFEKVYSQSWDYGSNGKDWQDPKCKENEEGSPIDLVGSFSDAPDLSLELSPNTADVSSILNFDGNRIWIDGKFATLIVDNSTTGKKITRHYESQRIDIKSPCEHLLQSGGCDIEIQLFCPETEASIQLNGDSQRPNVAFSFRYQSINKQTDNMFSEIDLSKIGMLTELNFFKAMENQPIFLSKKESKYAHYEGSLTIPFCDDVVQWFVYQPVLEITPAQLALIQKVTTKNETFSGLDKGNARQVQPLEKRKIYEGVLNLDGYKEQSRSKLKAYQCEWTYDYDKEMTLYGYDLDKQFLASTKDCELKVWEVKAKKEKCILTGVHKNDITAFAIRENMVVTGAKDKQIVIWDMNTAESTKILKGSEDFPTSLAWSHDGKFIASCYLNKKVFLWEAATGKFELFEGHDSGCTNVDFSSDDKKLVSTDEKGFVKVWDVKKKGDEALIKTYKAHKDRINALLIVKHYAVTGSDDKMITVADLDDDCVFFKFEGHEKEVTTLEFKAELEFASASLDKTVKIWDIKERLLKKSGEITKNQHWVLVGHQSVTCHVETDKDVLGVRFRQKLLNNKNKIRIGHNKKIQNVL